MSSEADAIQDSIRYLASDEAMRSLESDTYWPKWHSPWWHMTTLHEMGLADLIPKATVRKMVEHLQEDGMLEASCHCALGNIYQTLAACGVAVDEELPGIRPWFLRHQLPDGGLNCDDAAYLSESKPSSLVGTLPPLEAVLFHTPREFTPEEAAFLDRGASCVLDRKLMLGSRSPDNAEEREDEPDWLKPCFPRLYLYDVLRGLRFIVQWAKRRRQPLPLENIRDVVDYLRLRYPDGQVRIERHAYEGVGTRLQDESGSWKRHPTASHFPLLQETSHIGMVSPYLTRQWAETQAALNSIK